MLSIIGGFGYLVLNMYHANLANLSQTTLHDRTDNWNDGKNDVLKTIVRPPAKTKWQKVQGMKVHQVFVYSAYHDVRSGLTPVIRVIGVTRTKKPENLLCRMYFEEDDDQTFPLTSKDPNGIPDELQTKVNFYRDIPGKIKIIWGHHHKEYSACFILCPLTSLNNSSMKNKITAPTFVSVIPVSSNKTKMSNVLRVMNFEGETDGFHEEAKENLGVCIKPIRSNYNQTINLIEFIEFNKILGASKFFFYNLTMTHEIDCILNFYQHKENSVQVMDWDLPRKEPNLDLHDTGGLAARNDCVYRNMYNFKHLMMTDLDEYIVPRQHKDIIEMLEDLSKTNRNGNSMVAVSNSSAITSYNFKNAFFFLHYGKCKIEIASRYQCTDIIEIQMMNMNQIFDFTNTIEITCL